MFDENDLNEFQQFSYNLNSKNELQINYDIVFKQVVNFFQIQGYSRPFRVSSFFEDNIEFFRVILPPLFWLFHTKSFFPTETSIISLLSQEVQDLWKNFCLELEMNKKIDSNLKDLFYHSFPYFCAQVISEIYFLISTNIQIIHDLSFKIYICSVTVQLFTAIDPAFPHLFDRYSKYFVINSPNNRISLNNTLNTRPKSSDDTITTQKQNNIRKNLNNEKIFFQSLPKSCLFDRVNKMRRELSLNEVQNLYTWKDIEIMKQSALLSRKAAILRFVNQMKDQKL